MTNKKYKMIKNGYNKLSREYVHIKHKNKAILPIHFGYVIEQMPIIILEFCVHV